MAVDPVLTSTELTALGGATSVRRYLSYAPLTLVGSASIVSGSYPETSAYLNVSSPTAGWSNVRAGMTAVVNDANGNPYGWYRIRATPTSSVAYIMETALYDTGLVPQSTYVPLPSAGTIYVYDNYALWSVLPRILYTRGDAGILYEDYDASVGTNNTTPNVIANVRTRGVNQPYRGGKHYSTWVDSGVTTATIQWTASVIKWATSSGSSVSYAWSIPSGWTAVTGTTTDTLQATVPQGHHILKLTVTDSIGGVTESVSHVWVHGSSYEPIPLLNVDSDTEDRTGRRISLSVLRNDVRIPDGVMVNYWERATWNGTVPSGNTFTTQMPGWIVRNSYTFEGVQKTAAPELLSPSFCMQMLGGYSQYFERKASPANWQELVPALSTVHFVIYHMMRHRAGNLLKLFNYEPLTTDSASGRMPVFKVDGSNLLEQMQTLARSFYQSNWGCDSEGNFWMRKHPSFMTSGERSAVHVRATLGSEHVSAADVTRELRPKTRKVRGESFYNDGSATLPTPYLSDAPGNAPGQGVQETKVEGQILDAGQSEINQLAGNYWAWQNNPLSEVSVVIPKNWGVFSPSQMQFVSLQLPDTYVTEESLFSADVRFIPSSVSRQHSGSTVTTRLTVEGETLGGLGATVPVPPPNVQVYTPLPIIPSITLPPPPPPPVIPPEPPVIEVPGEPVSYTDGRCVVTLEDAAVYRTTSFLDPTPTWENVTPTLGSGYTIASGVPNLQSVRHRGWYLAATNGTQSKVFYTADMWAEAVSWQEGAVFDGAGLKIVSYRDTPQSASIYTTTGSGTLTYDFTIDEQGWAASSGLPANYVAATGWEDTYPPDPDSIYLDSPSFSARFVSSVTVNFSTSWTGTNPLILIQATDLTTIGSSASTGTSITISVNQVVSAFKLVADPYFGGGEHFSGYLTGVVVNAVDGASVVTVSDYGNTVDVTRMVGAGTAQAFDAGYTGNAFLAGAEEQVYRAQEIGGTYSAETGGTVTGTDPNGLLVMWYRWNSTGLTNYTTEPDYIFGTAAALSSQYLHRVVGGVRTGITPSGAGAVVGINGLASWKGTQLFALMDVSGTPHLFSSANGGATWTDRGAIANASSVRVRRFSAEPNMTQRQLVIARGTSGLYYSPDGGATLTNKAAPSANAQLYAEFFG